MRPTIAQSAGGSFHDMGRGREIRLPNFQMNDFSALRFQGTSANQDFEGSLGA
jgi:hypothetical protein